MPVSGMALGCDGVATAGALAAGGHPVAVLGSGIDIVYPSGHLTLYRADRAWHRYDRIPARNAAGRTQFFLSATA